MKKILITGSEGFLGKSFVDLYSDKFKFIKYDKKINGDLKNKKKFPEVDIVIHLAAFNSTKDFYQKPLEVIYDNIIPTMNLINFYVKKKNKPKFIFAGTPEIASGATDLFKIKLPTKENIPSIIPDILNKRWSYAGSKSLAEQTVIHSGLKFVIIRPHNVYGPNQKNHFIPEFLERSKNKKVKIFGWKNKRCWLYVEDFCEALYKIIISRKCSNQIINIGSNFEYTTYQVAKKILKLKYPKEKKILVKCNAPKGSVSRRVPDIRKIYSLVKWKPKIDLKEGLKRLLNYE